MRNILFISRGVKRTIGCVRISHPPNPSPHRGDKLWAFVLTRPLRTLSICNLKPAMLILSGIANSGWKSRHAKLWAVAAAYLAFALNNSPPRTLSIQDEQLAHPYFLRRGLGARELREGGSRSRVHRSRLRN